MRASNWATLLAFSMACTGANAQEPPKLNALSAVQQKVLEAIEGLVKSADEPLSTYRAQERTRKFRNYVAVSIMQGRVNPADKFGPDGLTAESCAANFDCRMVCSPIAAHGLLSTRKSFLAAAAGGMRTIGTSEVKDLSTAISAILANYSINIADRAVDTSKFTQETTASCVDDIVNYARTYFGVTNTPEEQEAAVVAAVLSLWNVIKSIIEPLAVTVGGEIDAEKRRSAILKFLSDETPRLKEYSKAITNYSSQNIVNNKRDKMWTIVATRKKLITALAKALEKSGCKEDGVRGAQPTVGYLTGNAFEGCYTIVTGDIEAALKSYLEATSQYDLAAGISTRDIERASSRFSELLDRRNTAAGLDGSEVRDLLAVASRLLAFGKQVEDAFSKESRDKVKKGVDDLISAWRG